jgi:hypothetical protein
MGLAAPQPPKQPQMPGAPPPMAKASEQGSEPNSSMPTPAQPMVQPAPAMPSMVNQMAQAPANGFSYRSNNDIYKMSDSERTDYWSNLRNHFGMVNNPRLGENDSMYGNGEYENYVAGLSDNLKRDFGGGNFYLDPQMRILGMQQEQAKDFRGKSPEMQRTMTEDLKAQANSGLSAANAGTKQNMSSRGLLNSNINRGAQGANRGRAQAGVAQGTADINRGLIDAQNTMDQNAISTGVQVQQSQQAIQNQIYSQAMARMNAQNAEAGSAMGLIGTAAMIAML